MSINLYGLTKGELWTVQKALDTCDQDDIRDAQEILEGVNNKCPLVVSPTDEPTDEEE